VSVTFTHRVVTAPGDTIKIAGNTAQLGNWNTASAPSLSASQYTSSNPIWKVTLRMAPGATVQYKFLKITSGGVVTWESDPNRAYTVPTCQANDALNSEWR
jgi:alpha-amylase